jgi:DNA anti-recombination protein RmuC
MLVVQKTSYAAALAHHSTNAGMFVPTEQAAITFITQKLEMLGGARKSRLAMVVLLFE